MYKIEVSEDKALYLVSLVIDSGRFRRGNAPGGTTSFAQNLEYIERLAFDEQAFSGGKLKVLQVWENLAGSFCDGHMVDGATMLIEMDDDSGLMMCFREFVAQKAAVTHIQFSRLFPLR